MFACHCILNGDCNLVVIGASQLRPAPLFSQCLTQPHTPLSPASLSAALPDGHSLIIASTGVSGKFTAFHTINRHGIPSSLSQRIETVPIFQLPERVTDPSKEPKCLYQLYMPQYPV